jgi:hypothetical protein
MEEDNILDFLDDEPKEESKPEAKVESKPIELTNEQKLAILKNFQDSKDPSIEELCEVAWPGKGFNGLNKEGRLIKKFLIEHDLKPKTKTEYTPKGLLPLTDEQKEYIKNNLNMKNHELAQVIWERPLLASTSQEARTIGAYRDELRRSGEVVNDLGEETTREYSPPKTIDRACARINKNVTGVNYDYKKLTPTQNKHVKALISNLNSYRFSHHMALIENPSDKTLFENTFIRYIYDKPDLTQEDLDQYLMLASEAVSESSIRRTIGMLEREQERIMEAEEKMNMVIVENIKNSRDELKACIKTQQSLFKGLDVERSKRLTERIGPQFTLLNIVEAMKNEETRAKMVAEAEKRNEKLKGEIKRLSDMDGLVASFWGLDEDTIING